MRSLSPPPPPPSLPTCHEHHRTIVSTPQRCAPNHERASSHRRARKWLPLEASGHCARKLAGVETLQEVKSHDGGLCGVRRGKPRQPNSERLRASCGRERWEGYWAAPCSFEFDDDNCHIPHENYPTACDAIEAVDE